MEGNTGINDGTDEIVDDVILYNNFASLRKKVFVKERVMTMAKPITNRKITVAPSTIVKKRESTKSGSTFKSSKSWVKQANS